MMQNTMFVPKKETEVLKRNKYNEPNEFLKEANNILTLQSTFHFRLCILSYPIWLFTFLCPG